MQRKLFAAAIGGLLLAGVAIYFLTLCVNSLLSRVDLLTNSVSVTGTVVSVAKTDESQFPTIAFRTTSGETVQFTSIVNGTYEQKDEVPIIYQRNNPQRASVNNFSSLWVAVLYQFCFGALLLVGSLVPLRIFWRNRWWLQRRQIVAPISEVKTVTDPGATTYDLRSRWTEPETGRTFVFESRDLDFDPRLDGSDELLVDIDPKNPAHYYIDKSLLKQQALNALLKTV